MIITYILFATSFILILVGTVLFGQQKKKILALYPNQFEAALKINAWTPLLGFQKKYPVIEVQAIELCKVAMRKFTICLTIAIIICIVAFIVGGLEIIALANYTQSLSTISG